MFTQGTTIGDLLLYEVHPRHCRKSVLIGALASIAAIGTVMGQLTATKEYVPLNPAGNDGSEDAVAILLEKLPVSDEAQKGVVLRRNAGVDADFLVWPDGITDPQKAAAIAQLEALGIDVETTL